MKSFAAFATVLMAISFVNTAFCQVQSWPPGGTTPSPVTAAMKLPSNRYVPSTKKYNLVWADELVGMPTGKIQFIARNYAASQKMSASQAGDYRAYNPDFLCIIYHLSNGINPQNNSDCPLPHGTTPITSCTPQGWVSEWDNNFVPWLASAGIALGSGRYEQMFQHYVSVDSNNRVWHGDPQWTMCLENADWQKYVADVSINWMTGEQDDGAFFDVCVETMVPGLYHPQQGDPAPHNFNWYLSPYGPAGYTVATLGDFATWMNGQYLGYWQSIYKRFHTASADFLILPNIDQMTTGWYDPVWTEGGAAGETIDGAMMENFGNATGGDMYLTLSRAVKHLTGRGKILIAQFYDTTQTERYRRTGMYMLVKNENSFINILGPGAPGWFPEYEISLGDQSPVPADISALRVAGSDASSLFRRDYQNGMVLCNTSGSAMNYAIPGNNWNTVTTSGGGSVSNAGAIAPQSITFTPVTAQVSVPAYGSLILTNNTAVTTSISRMRSGAGQLFSGPVNGVITVHRPGMVSVYGLDGVLKIKKQALGIKANIDISDLTRGIYIIKVAGASESRIMWTGKGGFPLSRE
ncbi:MAG TPA: T9SS type A sorting domain-containing protein [Chitinivibrionales bacterium]|nr:T9SS type A sorting domain-containing protein [Chitinivibrionales bacterium]